MSAMTKNRLEGFSDGVLAIVITIMVLEFRLPDSGGGGALSATQVLEHVRPVFLAYLLSFVFLGIYWCNHHHLVHAVDRVSGGMLWANLHLLFWLSLVPFTTHWLAHDSSHLDPAATAVYGAVLLAAGVAYRILVSAILAHHGPSSTLAQAIGGDFKGWISVALYVAAIPVALFVTPWISIGLYVAVAMIWLIPDRRIERRMAAGG
jgi:uncharacterized membrane protein